MNTTIISGRLVRNPGYNEVENEKGLHKIAKFVLAVRRNYSDEVSFIPVKASPGLSSGKQCSPAPCC